LRREKRVEPKKVGDRRRDKGEEEERARRACAEGWEIR
jgi:hypothetical protein